MKSPVLGQSDFFQALKLVVMLFVGQTFMTVIFWIGVTSTVWPINIIMVFELFCCVCMVCKIMQFSETQNAREIGFVPFAVMMFLCLSFTSFWSLLMVGCSND